MHLHECMDIDAPIYMHAPDDRGIIVTPIGGLSPKSP